MLFRSLDHADLAADADAHGHEAGEVGILGLNGGDESELAGGELIEGDLLGVSRACVEMDGVGRHGSTCD